MQDLLPVRWGLTTQHGRQTNAQVIIILGEHWKWMQKGVKNERIVRKQEKARFIVMWESRKLGPNIFDHKKGWAADWDTINVFV